MLLTPTQYLCDKFSCSPEEIIDRSILHLCGEKLGKRTDPEKYFEKNHIKFAKPDETVRDATIYQTAGGFYIQYDPNKIKDDADKKHAFWHEIAHTLFFRFINEFQDPVYEGQDWCPTPWHSSKEEEDICNLIAERLA